MPARSLSVQDLALTAPPPGKEFTYQFSLLALGPCSSWETLQDRGQGSEHPKGRGAPTPFPALSIKAQGPQEVTLSWLSPWNSRRMPVYSPVAHWVPSLLGHHCDRPLPAGDSG